MSFLHGLAPHAPAHPQPPLQPCTAPIHAAIKLAPIPLPREVRWEGHLLYALAWLGTALLALGAYWVSTQWLLYYGLAAVLAFALLFRLEGPRTRAQRLARLAHLQAMRLAYHQSEEQLQQVLQQRFAHLNQPEQEFAHLYALYQAHAQASQALENGSNSTLEALGAASSPASCYEPTPQSLDDARQLGRQIQQIEAQIMALVGGFEDFSSFCKQEVDEAVMACHNARLAYWQARLDAAVFTGEFVS